MRIFKEEDVDMVTGEVINKVGIKYPYLAHITLWNIIYETLKLLTKFQVMVNVEHPCYGYDVLVTNRIDDARGQGYMTLEELLPILLDPRYKLQASIVSDKAEESNESK